VQLDRSTGPGAASSGVHNDDSQVTDHRFAGKVAIVTGGASGIGAATASVLANGGAHVVLADVDERRGVELATSIGVRASFVRCDVSSWDEVSRLVAQAVDRHKGIDILFNNAGIGAPGRTPELSIEAWKRVIDVDLNAVFYACKAAIPHMVGRNASIINTSSISGMAADFGHGVYNAVKAAVINYSRSLALDHAREGLRVNTICPGLVHTGLTTPIHDDPNFLRSWTDSIPMGRSADPMEIAKVVAFLASEDASYITGAALVVDGGKTASVGHPDLERFLQR
jgi:meso-butanediol dehydrogenase / (S,S)-butanediol dehydrogenase / diacetyl reductase